MSFASTNPKELASNVRSFHLVNYTTPDVDVDGSKQGHVRCFKTMRHHIAHTVAST
jgi:hypothetical protein